MIPCSHIGHLFRKATYTFGGGDKNLIEHRNNVRILEMWLDGYKEFYYSIFPSKGRTQGQAFNAMPCLDRVLAADIFSDLRAKCCVLETRNIGPGDLTERKRIKERLQCRSFDWYLANIHPDSTMFNDFIAIGEVSGNNNNNSSTNNLLTSCVYLSMSIGCHQ